jgi:hypothetical protein
VVAVTVVVVRVVAMARDSRGPRVPGSVYVAVDPDCVDAGLRDCYQSSLMLFIRGRRGMDIQSQEATELQKRLIEETASKGGIHFELCLVEDL